MKQVKKASSTSDIVGKSGQLHAKNEVRPLLNPVQKG